MPNFSLDKQAQDSLSVLQDTTLTPMNEALFQAWAKANKIEKPDAPDDHVDYRGIYQESGGKILPNGQLQRFAQKLNHEDKLRGILQEQYLNRMDAAIQSGQDRKDQLHKDERQDITHQQKLEQETLKQKSQPHEARMGEMDLRRQKLDLHKQQMGLQSQELGNQGKKLDIVKTVVTPQPKVKTNAGQTTRSK
jgi:hypothetical protein